MYLRKNRLSNVQSVLLVLFVFNLLLAHLQAAPIPTSNSSDYNNTIATMSPTYEASYKKMTECERSLHWNCALKFGTLKSLKVDCNSKDLENCLSDHLNKSICQIEDPDTIHTIEELLNDIRRRFSKNKKCGNHEFLQNLHDYFRVLGEGVENNHAKMIDYSGSGDFIDDSEDGDEKGDSLKGESDEVKTISTQKNQSTLSKDLLFWRETAKQITEAKKILPGKMIFFEDPKYNKKREKKMSQKEFIANAWANLMDQYTNWYKRSPYHISI